MKGWWPPRHGRRKPGGQAQYSNHAIEIALTVGMVLHLRLRQTEGFLRSLLSLLVLDGQVPDHTTISRRAKKLGKLPICAAAGNKPVHILVDSTGLAIHVGTLRKPPRNRDWRKLHIAIDALTGEIIASDLTSQRAPDASRVPALIKEIKKPLGSVCADGAYDNESVYKAVENHTDNRSPRVLIPPKKNARVRPGTPTTRERNRNIRSRVKLGKRQWHTQSGYSRRSKVENTMYRYKSIIGPTMRARSPQGQRVEARAACRILNRMAALGMPESHRLTEAETGKAIRIAGIRVMHQSRSNAESAISAPDPFLVNVESAVQQRTNLTQLRSCEHRFPLPIRCPNIAQARVPIRPNASGLVAIEDASVFPGQR